MRNDKAAAKFAAALSFYKIGKCKDMLANGIPSMNSLSVGKAVYASPILLKLLLRELCAISILPILVS